MNPNVVSIILAAASANNIALSQTPGAAGDLTLNGSTVTGGVATLDHQRRILVTTVSNESAKTLTIYGTRRDGGAISETMTGPNATTGATTQDFYTVTRIAVSAAFTGAVTVGTNGVGSSGWQNLAYEISPFQVSIAVVVTGTVNYTVEYTYDDPNTGTDGVIGPFPGTASKVPTAWSLTALAAKTANAEGFIAPPTNGPVWGWRITMNSGSGTAVATAIQAGIKSGGG